VRCDGRTIEEWSSDDQAREVVEQTSARWSWPGTLRPLAVTAASAIRMDPREERGVVEQLFVRDHSQLAEYLAEVGVDSKDSDPVLLTALVAGLVSGLASVEPGLQLRCAIELERITRRRPDLLAPHKATLLRPLTAGRPPDVQWLVARLVPRLELDDQERTAAVESMVRLFEESPNGVVEANALQAIVAMAEGHPEHGALADRCTQRALASASAILRARAWRLLTQRRGS
jgi:hypothetical protein